MTQVFIVFNNPFKSNLWFFFNSTNIFRMKVKLINPSGEMEDGFHDKRYNGMVQKLDQKL